MTASKTKLEILNPLTSNGKHSIYMDIVNLPATVQFGITIKAYNTDDVGLYFQMTGSATGYSFTTVNLGLVASGGNIQQNLDQFFSRSKPSSGNLPSGELTEIITITLKGYTDSGYTSLKWTYNRSVHVYWINSADAAFTTDFSNNFDDGTIQGWAVTNESISQPTLNVATDYALSASYSLKISSNHTTSSPPAARFRVYKTFVTPNKATIYAIIDMRLGESSTDIRQKNIRIQNGDTLLLYLGKPYDSVNDNYFPIDRWVRLVVPLPQNTSVDFRVVHEHRTLAQYAYAYVWIDDFKIISK